MKESGADYISGVSLINNLTFITANDHRQPTNATGSSSPRHRLRRPNLSPAYSLTGAAIDPGLSPTLPALPML